MGSDWSNPLNRKGFSRQQRADQVPDVSGGDEGTVILVLVAIVIVLALIACFILGYYDLYLLATGKAKNPTVSGSTVSGGYFLQNHTAPVGNTPSPVYFDYLLMGFSVFATVLGAYLGYENREK
jgi:hypothetical protein